MKNILIVCQKHSMNQAMDMSALCIDHITKTLPSRQSEPMVFFLYAMHGIAIWCSIWLNIPSTRNHIQFVVLWILNIFMVSFIWLRNTCLRKITLRSLLCFRYGQYLRFTWLSRRNSMYITRLFYGLLWICYHLFKCQQRFTFNKLIESPYSMLY